MKIRFLILSLFFALSNSFAQSWSLSYNLPQSSIPFSLECKEDLILVPTKEGIYRSDNSGASWVKISDTVVYDISCFDKNVCFACSNGGVVYKTNNGGLSWTATTKPHPSKKLVDILALSPTKVIVDVALNVIGTSPNNLDTLYQYDSIYISTDAGATWTKANVPATETLTDYSRLRYIYSDSLIFTRSNNHNNLMVTYDLGANLRATNIQRSIARPILQIEMVSPETGFILFINDNGGGSDPSLNIYKTTDSGKNFSMLFDSKNITDNTNEQTTNGHCFDFIDANIGWLVGRFTQNADIYKTTNGGTQWVRDTLGFKNTGANSDFLKLFMQTTDYGWGIEKSTRKILRYGFPLNTGAQELVASNAIIYPNPSANGWFTVEGISDEQPNIIITDLTGRRVAEVTGNQIDLSRLAKGVYVAIIQYRNGENLYQKLIYK